MTQLATVDVPGAAGDWAALGFTVVDGAIPLANGAIRPGGEAGLTIAGDGGDAIAPGAADGVAIAVGEIIAGVEHANGAVDLDHVVLLTNSIERTSAAVDAALGLEQRRVRETPTVRQAFHRFADRDGTRGCIVEVVERPDIERTSLWGLVVNVADLDVAVAAADGLIGAPKDAVQPGRRIATVRRDAGLEVAVALMSP